MIPTLMLMMGCSGSNTDEVQQGIAENTSPENTVGVFNLRRVSTENFDSFASERGAFANFMYSEQALSTEDLLNTYRLPLDSCTAYFSAGDVIVAAGGISRYDYTNIDNETSLDAGEILTISSPAGTWLEVPLDQYTFAGSIQYEYRTRNLPMFNADTTSLKLNIPGAQYPAFTDIDIPDVSPLQIRSPQDGTITQLDTRFQWNAATSNNSFIRLVAQKNVGSERYEMDCTLEDDGEFEIPEPTRVLLSDLFKDYTFRMYRSAYTIVKDDSSLLLIIHTEGPV